MNSENRIDRAFGDARRRRQKAFIPFITGGDSDIETTEALVSALAQEGATAVEIGIPFSDPIAEGVVIQDADERALANGCTVDKLFLAVKRLRDRGVDIPTLFMTYINPIFAYGKDAFMERCASCGVDGVIIPDLPFEERGEVADACEKRGIRQILMIAPTSESRIAAIAGEASGFLYCVSSMGVTGVRSEITTDVGAMIERVRRVSSTPCAVGFGISTPEQAVAMAAISDGAIIGSAIVKIVAEHGSACVEPVRLYARGIIEALSGM